jgi:hypothetical protein
MIVLHWHIRCLEPSCSNNRCKITDYQKERPVVFMISWLMYSYSHVSNYTGAVLRGIESIRVLSLGDGNYRRTITRGTLSLLGSVGRSALLDGFSDIAKDLPLSGPESLWQLRIWLCKRWFHSVVYAVFVLVSIVVNSQLLVANLSWLNTDRHNISYWYLSPLYTYNDKISLWSLKWLIRGYNHTSTPPSDKLVLLV